MIDEGTLKSAFPEIAWDQPVLVIVTGLHRWVCRYCIVLHGLKAQDIIQQRAPEYVYLSRDEAFEHIERKHHD